MELGFNMTKNDDSNSTCFVSLNNSTRWFAPYLYLDETMRTLKVKRNNINNDFLCEIPHIWPIYGMDNTSCERVNTHTQTRSKCICFNLFFQFFILHIHRVTHGHASLVRCAVAADVLMSTNKCESHTCGAHTRREQWVVAQRRREEIS